MLQTWRYCQSQGSKLTTPIVTSSGSLNLRPQLSLGDARSYYLSTASNELGVVYATSESGGWSSKFQLGPPVTTLAFTDNHRKPAAAGFLSGNGGPNKWADRKTESRKAGRRVDVYLLTYDTPSIFTYNRERFLVGNTS
jgi:hypothetical protein